jgi:hypothetical protein
MQSSLTLARIMRRRAKNKKKARPLTREEIRNHGKGLAVTNIVGLLWWAVVIVQRPVLLTICDTPNSAPSWSGYVHALVALHGICTLMCIGAAWTQYYGLFLMMVYRMFSSVLYLITVISVMWLYGVWMVSRSFASPDDITKVFTYCDILGVNGHWAFGHATVCLLFTLIGPRHLEFAVQMLE